MDVLLAEQSARGNDVESEDESDEEEEGERGGAHADEEEEVRPPTVQGPALCAMGTSLYTILTSQAAQPVSFDSDNDPVDADEDVVVLRDKPMHDSEDEDARLDFDREFAKMLADTTDAKRGERKVAPIFDTAVPLIRRPIAVGAVGSSAGVSTGMDRHDRSKSGDSPQVGNGAGEVGGGEGIGEKMQFSLLSKKGNKQQVCLCSQRSGAYQKGHSPALPRVCGESVANTQIRDIAIPLDSAIAVNSRTHQLKNKAEQEQLKRLVLQNERRQGQSEMTRTFFHLVSEQACARTERCRLR